jgi:hypothetical protein
MFRLAQEDRLPARRELFANPSGLLSLTSKFTTF